MKQRDRFIQSSAYFFRKLLWRVRLFLFFKQFIQCKKVTLMVAPPGFGHSVSGIEVTRRLYMDDHPAFILCAKYADGYNHSLRKLFPDVAIIFLPIDYFFFRGWLYRWNKNISMEVLEKEVERCARDTLKTISKAINVHSLVECYNEMPVCKEALEKIPQAIRKTTRAAPFLGYGKLLKNVVPKKEARLSEGDREQVKRAIERFGKSETGTCTLYLRNEQNIHVSGSSRNGSPLKEYLQTITLLTERGYRVLLIGDRDSELTKELFENYKGMLLSGEQLDVCKELFLLYAGTEVDFFIGEAGGGGFLPLVRNVPCLFVNAFPYGFGLPNSWMFYKPVFDRSGAPLNPKELFTTHAYEYAFEGSNVRNNSGEEIAEAVGEFLQMVRGENVRDAFKIFSIPVSEGTWTSQMEAKLLPVWMKCYYPG